MIGAFALKAYGYTRATQDVDFVARQRDQRKIKETDRNQNKIDSDPALLDAAETWLKKALEEHGVGAKTSIGYGYFSV